MKFVITPDTGEDNRSTETAIFYGNEWK